MIRVISTFMKQIKKVQITKAMRSCNIFEVRCIFGKIGPGTQKIRSGISGRFLFRTLLPTGVPFRNHKNGPKIFAKIH